MRRFSRRPPCGEVTARGSRAKLPAPRSRRAAQKSREPTLQLLCVARLALPNHEDTPALRLQGRSRRAIPGAVARELWQPVFLPRPRLLASEATCVLMPEA